MTIQMSVSDRLLASELVQLLPADANGDRAPRLGNVKSLSAAAALMQPGAFRFTEAELLKWNIHSSPDGNTRWKTHEEQEDGSDDPAKPIEQDSPIEFTRSTTALMISVMREYDAAEALGTQHLGLYHLFIPEDGESTVVDEATKVIADAAAGGSGE
jgi:hypothetical protein